jgi:hypothetical protein
MRMLSILRAGARGEHLLQRQPDSSRRGVICDTHKNFPREGRKKIAERLVVSQPLGVLSIGHLRDGVAGLDSGLGQLSFDAGEDILELCSADCQKDLRTRETISDLHSEGRWGGGGEQSRIAGHLWMCRECRLCYHVNNSRLDWFCHTISGA